MSSRALAAVFGVALMAFGAACGSGAPAAGGEKPAGGEKAPAGAAATAPAAPAATTAPAAAPLVVTAPKPNEEVSIPIQVEGSGSKAGNTVYAAMYERGNMISESQVKAEEGGKFLFNALFLLGEHDPAIELRVYEKDGTGKPVSLATIPLKLVKK